MAIAIAGCGAVIREYYVPALRQLAAHGWVSSVRLYDLDAERAREVATALPASRAVRSWQALLDGPEELIVVASPPAAHAEQVQTALAHGKHVLCEKPFTLHHASAFELARQADEAGLLCAVGMVRRFSRAAGWLKAFVATERPGQPARLTWNEGRTFRWPIRTTAYFTSDPGNRLLWDIGSHAVDLVTWWLGAPQSFRCRDDGMGGPEANCLLELRWANGSLGELRLSRDSDVPGGLVVERGDDRIRCPDVCENLLAWERGCSPRVVGAVETLSSQPALPTAVGFPQCFLAQLENVLDSIRGAAELRVPAHSVLDAIRCLEGCDASRELLEPPWLSPPELERARELRRSTSPVTV